MVLEVTGIGHERGFKVKWSDGIQSEETVRGLATLVLRRLKKGEGSERDAMASNVMLLIVRTTLTMMRKVRKRKKGTIVKVKTLKKIILLSNSLPLSDTTPHGRPMHMKSEMYAMVMKVIGEAELNVTYGHDKHPLRLYVVEGNGPSLVDSVLQKNEDVFVEDVSGFKAKLRVKANAVPRFLRARPIPFALKNAVGKELDRLETLGILRKVTHSAWASPIVVVPKKDGRLCSCGDFKVTVNAVLDVNKYPLPKPDDLFAALEGGLRFTKLNLRQAYQQLALEEGSQEFVTVNTHQGLYQFTRLPFGVASAPAIFQKIMDEILQGIPRVVCYLDDILISGSSDKEHLTNLEEVLKRLREAGIHLLNHNNVDGLSRLPLSQVKPSAFEVQNTDFTCQVAKSAPPKAPLHPWVWPSKPWERIHVDFAGPFQRKTFFIVVDAHSKWPEVIPMSTTTSLATVVELTRLFASYGIPQQLMSDNGSQWAIP
eukprot:Em0001g2412a